MEKKDPNGAVDLGAIAEEKSDAESMADAAEQFSQEVFDDISGKSAGGVEVICPGTVHSITGAPVRATQLNAIIMSSIGVFVVGEAGTRDGGEVSRLIPWDNLAYIDYDRDLMMELVKKVNS